MVIGSHLIITAAGFWLPNDPRGSWSDFVRAWELVFFGKATKIDERRSVARRPHDRTTRIAAKGALKYGAVEFSGLQARAIARGFAKALRESGYIVVACAILPTHVHLVVLRHGRLAERIMGHLKARATQQLVEEGLHPFVHLRRENGRFPSVWAHRGWRVYLDSVEDILRAVRYVENNLVREGKREQSWKFVTPFSVELLNFAPRKRGR